MNYSLLISVLLTASSPVLVRDQVGQKPQTGFDRLNAVKSACDITEDEAATIFPLFAVDVSEGGGIEPNRRRNDSQINGGQAKDVDSQIRRCLRSGFIDPGNLSSMQIRDESNGDTRCRLGGIEGAEERLASARHNSPGPAKKRLDPLALDRFNTWQRSNGCFTNLAATKEIVSMVHIEAEEYCKTKGLAAMPAYMIFKNMKNQGAISEGGDNKTPTDPETIQIYTPEYKDWIANDFASSAVIKAGSDADAVNGTKSSSTTVTGTGGGALTGSLTPVGVGASVTGSAGVSVAGNWSETKPQPLNFDKIRANARELALSRPEITGFKPDYECKGDKCRNRSDNVWFPRSEAPAKMGCTPGKNCKLAPNYDPEAVIAGCAEKEVVEYYNKLGILTQDPDLWLMDATKESDPDADLKMGYCDIHTRGADFCREWKFQTLETKAAPWIAQEAALRFERAKELLKITGVCDKAFLGAAYCAEIKNEQAKKRVEPRLDDLGASVDDVLVKLAESEAEKGNAESVEALSALLKKNGGIASIYSPEDKAYCLKLLEDNRKSTIPKSASQLFSSAEAKKKGCSATISPTLDPTSIFALGKCLRSDANCDARPADSLDGAVFSPSLSPLPPARGIRIPSIVDDTFLLELPTRN